jgi:hypothetical protein
MTVPRRAREPNRHDVTRGSWQFGRSGRRSALHIAEDVSTEFARCGWAVRQEISSLDASMMRGIAWTSLERGERGVGTR